jgi:hypothetical protein
MSLNRVNQYWRRLGYAPRPSSESAGRDEISGFNVQPPSSLITTLQTPWVRTTVCKPIIIRISDYISHGHANDLCRENNGLKSTERSYIA